MMAGHGAGTSRPRRFAQRHRERVCPPCATSLHCMSRVEQWQHLQQSIAAAELAYRVATAAAVADDLTFAQVLDAAERARQALRACEEAFTQWKRALDRHVSERP